MEKDTPPAPSLALESQVPSSPAEKAPVWDQQGKAGSETFLGSPPNPPLGTSRVPGPIIPSGAKKAERLWGRKPPQGHRERHPTGSAPKPHHLQQKSLSPPDGDDQGQGKAEGLRGKGDNPPPRLLQSHHPQQVDLRPSWLPSWQPLPCLWSPKSHHPQWDQGEADEAERLRGETPPPALVPLESQAPSSPAGPR